MFTVYIKNKSNWKVGTLYDVWVLALSLIISASVN